QGVLDRCGCIKSCEDVCIFLCHTFLASLLDCTVNYVESTTLNFSDTNRWVSVDFEFWNNYTVTEYAGFWTSTVAGDNNCGNIDISIVSWHCTLWKRVNNKGSTGNTVVVQVTTNWVCHCLSKSNLSVLGHNSARNKLITLVIA